MKNKILSLESLRGLAALTVVFDHFFRTFYPATFANGAISHSKLEWYFINTPLFFVVNGAFAVTIFFVLSGFVLSYGFFHKGADLVSNVVKRYFRLMPIVLASVIFAYIILKLNLFFNDDAGIMPFSWRDNDISFLSALWDGLVGVFVVQSVDASLNSPLWTIYYEMIGSVIVYALLALIGKDSRRPYVYPLLILIFANTNFIGFIVGLILADLYCNRQGVFKFITNLALPYKLVGLSLAITFASFPPLRTATTTSLVHQPLLFLTQNYTLNATILYLAAAVIIILLLLTSRRLNKLMELRPIVSLGSASYSLYATHLIVLGSIGSFAFFILTKKYGLPYNYSAAITFVTYVISALIVASIFRKYVDSRSIYLSQLVGQIIRNKAVNTKTKQKEGVEDYQLVRVNDPIS